MPTYVKPNHDNKRKDDYVSEIERFRTPEELKTSVRFNDDLPLERMRQYVTGMKWEVTYYNQYLDVNDNSNTPDQYASVSNQNYSRIDKLIIYVQTPLEQNKITDLSIEAIINAGFTPKTGDAFIANLIGGRIGMFIVEESSMEHYNLHSTFNVTFKLHTFLEDNHELYNNLEAKVSKHFIYNNNYIQDRTSSILTRHEHAVANDVKNAIDDLSDNYFKIFLDDDTKFLKLPADHDNNYVDQELGKFCRVVYSVLDYPELTEMQTVDYTMNKSVRYTIWDLLLKRDPNLLNRIEPGIGFMPSPFSTSNLNTIEARYMDIDYIVDKTETPITITAVENTSKEKLIPTSSFPVLDAMEEDEDKQKEIATNLFDISIPGLDFETKAKKEPIEEEPKKECPIIKPEELSENQKKSAINAGKDKKEYETKEIGIENIKIDIKDVNTAIPKTEEEIKLKPKVVNANIPSIKATKQYNRYPNKGNT